MAAPGPPWQVFSRKPANGTNDSSTTATHSSPTSRRPTLASLWAATALTCWRPRPGSERGVPLAVALHKNAGLIALGGASKRAMVRSFDDHEVPVGAPDDFALALQF